MVSDTMDTSINYKLSLEGTMKQLSKSVTASQSVTVKATSKTDMSEGPPILVVGGIVIAFSVIPIAFSTSMVIWLSLGIAMVLATILIGAISKFTFTMEDLQGNLKKVGLQNPVPMGGPKAVLKTFFRLSTKENKRLLSVKYLNITKEKYLPQDKLCNFNALVVPESLASHVSKVYLETSKKGFYVTQETVPTALNLWDNGIIQEIETHQLAGFVLQALEPVEDE